MAVRRRDLFFIVVILIFIGNIYFIAKSRATTSTPPAGHGHDHGHHGGNKHDKDSSGEHTDTQSQELPPPYVSIIIPLYNQLQYLQTALDSVFSQSFQDYEIIIINDGSTEWSVRSTLDSIRASFPDKRITVIHQTRGGLSHARNTGIAQASAAWILPLDADDKLDNSFLQSAVSASRNPGVNLVISDLVGFDTNDQSRIVSQWSVPTWDAKELPKKNMLHCCPLYKKDLWESVNGYNPVMVFGWEDWEFWLRVNKQIPIKPYTLHDEKFYYRVKPGMHSFCTDYNSLCTSILKTVQPSFYSVEEILHAHQIIANNKDIALQPIQRQLTEFCDTTALHLWKGIILEKEGRVKEAVLDYEQAKRFAEKDDWQPMLRLAFASGEEKYLRELEKLYERYTGLREAAGAILGRKLSNNRNYQRE